MNFYNKIKWVLGILMVFILIITTNLIDRTNFTQIRDSAVTIYEDRLLAKNYIFEISKLIHKKELALAKEDAAFFKQGNKLINSSIKDYIDKFENTKLTTKENKVFENFKNDFQNLEESESKFLSNNDNGSKKIESLITKLKTNLDDLSHIQINEGKRQISISEKAISTVELFTRLEIYILIFLAIVIQIVVMYTPKK